MAEHLGITLKPLSEFTAGSERQLFALCPEDEAGSLAQLAEAGQSLVLVSSFRGSGSAKAAVALPACSPFERGGSYVNADGIVQEARKVLSAPGIARSPWIQLRNVARAADLGAAFPTTRVEAQDKVFAAVPALAGLLRDKMNEEPQRLAVPGDAAPSKEAP